MFCKIAEVCRAAKPELSGMLRAFLLAATVPLAAAWGYCNDKDISCAAWANAGECEGKNTTDASGCTGDDCRFTFKTSISGPGEGWG